MALSFENAVIAGRLILGDHFSALGRVVLSHTRVESDLIVNGGGPDREVHIKNDGIAVQAFGLTVLRAIVWRNVTVAGFVDMRLLRVSSWTTI